MYIGLISDISATCMAKGTATASLHPSLLCLFFSVPYTYYVSPDHEVLPAAGSQSIDMNTHLSADAISIPSSQCCDQSAVSASNTSSAAT